MAGAGKQQAEVGSLKKIDASPNCLGSLVMRGKKVFFFRNQPEFLPKN